MKSALDKLTIKGFKSIRELTDFQLKNLNIIVGANGAGKSNLISFFKMMSNLMAGHLNRYVRENGGAGDLLFNGRKTTHKMTFQVGFGTTEYRFKLSPTPNGICVLEEEAQKSGENDTEWQELGDSQDGQPRIMDKSLKTNHNDRCSKSIIDAISSWQIYHFHDTGPTASMRHYEIVQDDARLRTDAANIAPFLYKLKNNHLDAYNDILNAIRMVTPFFDDFELTPRKMGAKLEVNLSWTQKGSDYPMQPYQFSDGTIRFICLATALLQPDPPATIIIDEPELGLHPAAISILAELIQVASLQTQIIIATQSPALLDYFGVEDIVVVNRKNGASIFKRYLKDEFLVWLEDYSLGELWVKNVIAGGAVHE